MQRLTRDERSRIHHYLTETSFSVLSSVEPLSISQLTFRPKPDRWTIAEIVQHLATVDALVMSQVFATVNAGGPTKVGSWAGRDDELLERVRSPNPPLKAPEVIAPADDQDPKEILAQFRECSQRILAFVSTTETPLRRYCFAHPVFGYLDCYQWLLCAGAHYERHMTQICGVMQTPGFPVPIKASEWSPNLVAVQA